MKYLEQSFQVQFDYKVFFTSGLFHASNQSFREFLHAHSVEGMRQKILFIIDHGVLDAHPQLPEQITSYFHSCPQVFLVPEMCVIPGGETAKNSPRFVDDIIRAIDTNGIDRQSYVAAIGGGSVLDLAGYAAAIAHRGIRHIRIPTTVLAQNDSGVGVKNGINYKGKKNFLGTFVPPVAVFNDELFLTTLDERNWRSGLSEAVKVALIRDAAFFTWIENHAAHLAQRNLELTNDLIHRCAELHLQHIASGDPFEKGSSRPLDFGHWSAHKLEQSDRFRILHGEAVAIGIALDTVYSWLSGKLPREKSDRVLRLLKDLGFAVHHKMLAFEDDNDVIFRGLQEFREHLGGRLTIMLLRDIGRGEEVHEMDLTLLRQAARWLKDFEAEEEHHEPSGATCS